MENDPRVSLLITEADDRRADPQTLARVSIRGMAEVFPRTHSSYAQVKRNYLERFPEAEQLFSLGDFNIWGILLKTQLFGSQLYLLIERFDRHTKITSDWRTALEISNDQSCPGTSFTSSSPTSNPSAVNF